MRFGTGAKINDSESASFRFKTSILTIASHSSGCPDCDGYRVRGGRRVRHVACDNGGSRGQARMSRLGKHRGLVLALDVKVIVTPSYKLHMCIRHSPYKSYRVV